MPPPRSLISTAASGEVDRVLRITREGALSPLTLKAVQTDLIITAGQRNVFVKVSWGGEGGGGAVLGGITPRNRCEEV